VEPFTAVKVGSSLLGGIFGSSAANKQARRAKQIGEYNAKVAMIQSEAEQDAIEFTSKRLVKQQREIKAQQRMSIASRNGLERAGDLLSLIESAKNMQLGLLEVERKQDIAQIGGETQAQQIRMGAEAQASAYKAQSRQAMIGGVLGAASALSKMPTKTPSPAQPNYLAMNTRTPFGGSSFNLSGDMYT